MSAAGFPLSALVLAGGRARRLGQDKPAAEVGGSSLLQRALAVAREVSRDVILLPRALHPAPAVPAGVRVVADWPAVEGPLAGLGAGLEAARHPWCLLLPCDLPFASARVVWRLVARARQTHAPALVLATAASLQPFHGLYHRSLLPALVAYRDEGRRSLVGLLERCGAEALPVSELEEDERFLLDVDTPADLAAARELAR